MQVSTSQITMMNRMTHVQSVGKVNCCNQEIRSLFFLQCTALQRINSILVAPCSSARPMCVRNCQRFENSANRVQRTLAVRVAGNEGINSCSAHHNCVACQIGDEHN